MDIKQPWTEQRVAEVVVVVVVIGVVVKMYIGWSLCTFVFTRMPHESYCRRLGSLLLHLCHVFWVLINSLVYWFGGGGGGSGGGGGDCGGGGGGSGGGGGDCGGGGSQAGI